MAKNRYCLFVRNKDNDTVKLISLSEFDIYNEGDKTPHSSNSLENIDVFTMSFNTSSDLATYLVEHNIIESYNVDIFVVSRRGDNIEYYEALYASDKLSSNVMMLALSKRDGREADGFKHTDFILDLFGRMMINNTDFYKFVVAKYNKIYSKYISYFYGCSNESMAYNVKFRDGAWARSSYPLVRNIVLAFNEFDKLKKSENIVYSAKEKSLALENRRNKCIDDISIYSDKYYADGQLSLFITNDINVNKLDAITNFLKDVSYDMFSVESNKISFNLDSFNVSDIDKFRFNSIDYNVITFMFLIATYNLFECNPNVDDKISQLNCEMLTYLQNNPNILNKTFALINLYKGYCTRFKKSSSYIKKDSV